MNQRGQTYFIIIILICVQYVRAQHFQFSQFYAVPMHLNPAFTGANVCSRVSVNYRNQWSGIPGEFTTYQLSVDHTMRRFKGGLGFQLLRDQAGIGGLTTTQANLMYSYETKLSKGTMGRGGISLGNAQRKIDYTHLVMGDQLARGGDVTSIEDFTVKRVNYWDVGAGVLVFTRSMWFGLSAAHLNKPNQSLMGGSSPLPPEIKLHGGYKFIFSESGGTNKRIPDNNSVTFAFNYKKQAKFNQTDIGLYYSKSLLVFGVWYRGLPFYKPVPGYANNDAAVFLFGINIEKYKIGYSYDMTISKLTNVSSKGTHEVSMSYQFCSQKKSKKKKNVLISCPKF
jgi:type IX secretion system PorP/SprF family membrane protein